MVSKEATLSAQHSGRPLGGQSSAPDPARWGAHSAPLTWAASPGGVWGIQ